MKQSTFPQLSTMGSGPIPLLEPELLDDALVTPAKPPAPAGNPPIPPSPDEDDDWPLLTPDPPIPLEVDEVDAEELELPELTVGGS